MRPSILAVELVRGSSLTLVRQLVDRVRTVVSTGTLQPGDRLPSIRALATDLGVARAVIEGAYDQLIAEGWLIGRHGSGTYVGDIGRLAASAPVVGRRRPAPEPAETLIPMDTGTPWTDPRHEAGWRRAWREVSVSRMPRGYPDPHGIGELRAELASYLSRTRGLACAPENVLVTGGTGHGYGLLLDVLEPGAIAIEDPGYRAAVALTAQQGRAVVDVPIDAGGIDVAALRSAGPVVRAIYVTPAHQHPLGITMSAGRRVALLAEARRRSALVVEDDYDSEFRYDVAPLPALAALDGDRVVYLGSASKSVHPALRIGWLVGAADLVATIARRRAERHDHPSWPMQRAFLAMLRDGQVDRLVRSARRVYADRSRTVSEALAPYGLIETPPAGMYVTARLPGPLAEAVRKRCRQAGFDVGDLAGYSRSSALTGLVIGFGGLSDDELARALDAMTSALGQPH